MYTNTLREARLIIPRKSEHVLEVVRRELVELFDGYTETRGRGACKLASGCTCTEEIHIFDVAIPERGVGVLKNLAEYVAIAAKQESVYLRHPHGTVEFVKPDSSLLASIERGYKQRIYEHGRH